MKTLFFDQSCVEIKGYLLDENFETIEECVVRAVPVDGATFAVDEDTDFSEAFDDIDESLARGVLLDEIEFRGEKVNVAQLFFYHWTEIDEQEEFIEEFPHLIEEPDYDGTLVFDDKWKDIPLIKEQVEMIKDARKQ